MLQLFILFSFAISDASAGCLEDLKNRYFPTVHEWTQEIFELRVLSYRERLRAGWVPAREITGVEVFALIEAVSQESGNIPLLQGYQKCSETECLQKAQKTFRKLKIGLEQVWNPVSPTGHQSGSEAIDVFDRDQFEIALAAYLRLRINIDAPTSVLQRIFGVQSFSTFLHRMAIEHITGRKIQETFSTALWLTKPTLWGKARSQMQQKPIVKAMWKTFLLNFGYQWVRAQFPLANGLLPDVFLPPVRAGIAESILRNQSQLEAAFVEGGEVGLDHEFRKLYAGWRRIYRLPFQSAYTTQNVVGLSARIVPLVSLGSIGYFTFQFVYPPDDPRTCEERYQQSIDLWMEVYATSHGGAQLTATRDSVEFENMIRQADLIFANCNEKSTGQ